MTPTVRNMTRSELDTAVEWAAAEGWGPGRGDAEAFFAADPTGFWALDVDGEMVASLSAVGYPGGMHFMGFYIVHPDHRGAGLGLRLWEDVWARLAGLPLAGDAVAGQLANYQRDGFVPAHRNARYVGVLPESTDSGRGLVDAGQVGFDDLVRFDSEHVFGARPAFLTEWIRPADRRALVTLDEQGAITGFGVIRPAVDGHRVGPLFAADPAVAGKLLAALGLGLGGKIAIDVPLPNAEAVELVESLGLVPGFETFRIYRGPDPGLPLDRIFAITSLELG